LIDLLACEYGWTTNEIDSLPIDETAELFHAILFRKGAKCYKKDIQFDGAKIGDLSSKEWQQVEIDTNELEEGITWLLP